MSEKKIDTDMTEISDEELVEVSGGNGGLGETYCPKCKGVRNVMAFSGGRVVCKTCNTQINTVIS